MLVNADMTVYEKDSFAQQLIENVYWNDSRGQSVTKNGIQISDSITVYLYSDKYIPKAGDLIVRGKQDFKFDVSSQKSVSESLKKLRTLYPDFVVVKSVNNCMYGGLPHIELIAR